MFLRLASFFFFLFLFFLSSFQATGGETTTTRSGESGATVLIYHRFDEDKYPSTNIDTARFREQLEYLKSHNYTVISLQELVDSLHHNSSLPARSVVITIDDGYRSVYEKAWPLLKEYGFPFTVFLYTKATENKHWNYLTWSQVAEMKAAGVDFQDHGFAHEHMAFRPSGLNMTQYRDWIRADIELSNRLLSEKLGEKPRFFAVPYGEYNQILLDEIRSLGYEAILLQDPGSVSNETDSFAIPREPILGTDWSTMQHFQRVLDRVDLPIAGEVPATGLLSSSVPEQFGAQLLHPKRYIPGTLGVYVSELGWHQADLKGDFVSISNNRPLTRRINRVAISGREKESGKTAIRYWMLVKDTED
jgi:peptidoglycan/xylan/chitin deacetylase (PgdA/CDA1 family)